VPTTRPRDKEARQAGEEITEWILDGTGPKMDIAAAEEVKHVRLMANYDA
jgi:hypothetical protein